MRDPQPADAITTASTPASLKTSMLRLGHRPRRVEVADVGVYGSAAGLAFRDHHLASVPVEHPDYGVHLVATEQRHDAS